MSMNITFFVIPQKLVFKKIWGSRDDNQANMEMPTLIKCLMCEIKSLQNMYIGMTIWVRVTVLNATFSNISVILCLSVLLVEETGGP